MRKWNAILCAGILILFCVHAVAGAFVLAGIFSGGNRLLSALTWLMVVFIVFHAVLGVKLTVNSILACKKAGISYFRENKVFWARRISGFATLLLMGFHIALFSVSGNGAFRLNFFGEVDLVIELLFLAAVAVHVISNVKPLLLSFGVKDLREFAVDLLILFSVFLIVAGVAFFLYYLRWNL